MSDYQNSSLSSSAKKNVPQTIVNAMVKAGVDPELALIGGDYTDGSVGADGDDTSQANLKTELKNLTGVLISAWSGLPYYAIQGNHDYSGFLSDGTLTKTGAYEKDAYIVYLINEDDFPWWQGNYGSGSSTAQDKATVTATTNALTTYLDNLIASGDTRPVIIMTHVPLHWSERSTASNWYFDNIYANTLFGAVNDAAEDLDILFLFGHNHSSTASGGDYDNEIGGALAYVAKGESMKVPNGKDGTSNYTTEKLNFTYMNAGYVGKYAGSTTNCSISAIEITESSINIDRYTYNGKVYEETIELENTTPRITITDDATGVSLSVLSDNTLRVNTVTVNALEDKTQYTKYTAYNIALGTPLAAGETARVSLPADGFNAKSKVYFVESNNTLTEIDATISNGCASFSTDRVGTFAIAEPNLPYVQITVDGTTSDGVFYHVTDELEAGNIYLLVSNDSYMKAIQDTGEEYTQSSWDYETTIALQSMSSDTDSAGEYISCTDESLMWKAVPGGIDGYFYLQNVATGAYLRAGYQVDTTYGRNISTTTSTSSVYVNFKAVSSSGSGIYAVQNKSNLSTYRWVRYSNSDKWMQGRTSYPSGAVQLWQQSGSTSSQTTVTVSMEQLQGMVKQNASSSAATGAQLTVAYENGKEETVDVTVGMLTDANGKAVSTATAGTLKNLTVTYLGTVITTSFQLEIVGMDGSWVELPVPDGFVIDTDGVDYGSAYLIVSTYSDSSSGDSSAFRHSGYHALDSNAVTTSSSYGTSPVYGVVATVSGSGDSKTAVIDEDYLDTALWTITKDGIRNQDGLYVDISSSAYSEAGSYYNMAFKSSDNRDWTIGRSGDYYTFTTTYNSNSYKLQYNSWRHSYMYTKSETSNLTFELYKASTGSSGTYAHLTGELEQSYLAADAVSLSTVLNKVKIQRGSSDTDASIEQIAVTSDMVSWDKAFNASSAGTYVGTVTYENTVIGTINVTITANHTYESVTVDATCTTDGSVTYTCTACGDTYTEVIPATGSHTNEVVTVAATCTEAGSVTTACTVCGETTTEVIEALGHAYASVVTAPTCTEAGFTTYTCATCADSYTADPVAALGHNYSSVITATCTKDGYEVFTCGTCGDSYQGDAVAALGHSYTTSTVAPTCTAEGYTTYLCTVCGESHMGDTVAALGHDYKAVTTEATCTEAGYTTYTCNLCDHSYVGDEVAALGHDYESVVTAPTFTEMGYTTHTCKVCGDVTVDSYVPVLQHTYESVTVEPTCTENGSVTYTCVECGDTYTEVIPALGHDYKAVTTDPTCTEDGSVVTTCAVCGDEQIEVIPALGHSFETVTVAPTCTADGYTTHTCACGEIRTETVPALGHDYSSVVTAPTCTEAGFTTYTCDTCGHTYTADQVAAMGHDYDAVVTAPTCTEAGFTTYTCAVCGNSYVGAQTAALGHSYTTEEVDGYLVYTCACGHSYSEKLTTELVYNKVSAFTSGEHYVITVYSGSKYYALSHAGNSISAVQVTVSGNQITSEITEDMLWDYSGSKLSYQANGTTYYLYAQPASGWFAWFSTPTLTVSTSNSTAVSISSNKLKVGSYYLRYSSSKFSLNRSGTTASLFQQTEA